MLTPQLINALQKQVTLERQNSVTYLSFAVQLEANNWPGFGGFFRKASEEEMRHSERFQQYLIDRNQVPFIEPLEAPAMVAVMLNSPVGGDVIPYFEAGLVAEQKTTEAICNIYKAASDDPQTLAWLYWALEEQTHSEREYTDALLELRRARGSSMLILDREYGER